MNQLTSLNFCIFFGHSRLGSDPQKLFPYDALLEQLQKFGVYAAFIGAFLFPILHAEKGSMPTTDNTEGYGKADGFGNVVFRISSESKQAYNKIVTEMFIDMARLGYI